MGSALAKACEAPLARCCWGADDHATHYAGVLDAAELSRAPSAMTIASSRRLSRSKTGLLLVDPVTVSLLADEELKKARSENATQVEAADAVVTLAGGVPGLALDGQRVELTEFTGARSGGYRSSNGRLRWGIRSRAGNDPLRRRKENQDALCVTDALAGDASATLFAVFDGHGPQGAFVSHLIREQYHLALADAFQNLAMPKNPAVAVEMFTQAAATTAERLAASSIDTSVSGSTAVSMLVHNRNVFIANVGDSRAIVARLDAQQDRYVLHCESLDHKPDVPDERARIEANNGRVFEWGSYRVWLQDVDMPGLGMSRSFGDAVAKTVGVTADPDIITVDGSSWVSDGDQGPPKAFAVLASDGIWEFFGSDECIDFVSTCIRQEGMSPQEACDALVEEAFERWNAEEDVVDDITVALVYF